METDSYGWIVIQRRLNSETSFQRKRVEYKEGFGDLKGNYWIGLDKLNTLTTSGRLAMLRIDLRLSSDPYTMYFAVYDEFIVEDEYTGYLMFISGYQTWSNLEDQFTGDASQYGLPFYTSDELGFDDMNVRCKVPRSGGWWYDGCSRLNLNAVYGSNGVNSCYSTPAPLEANEIYYHGLTNCENKITFVEMKIKFTSY